MSSPSTQSPDRETAPASADEQMVAAIKKHQSGQLREAAAIYAAVLEASPNHVDALHFLGVAEHQTGNSEKALEHIGRALDLAPDHADARNNRGNILKQLGRLEEAEADYTRSLALRPSDANALNNLGTVRRARGDLEGAALAFREAVKARLGHAPAWQNLGNVLRDLGRPGEAVDAFWESLRLAPQSTDSYRQLGAMFSSAGRIDKAIEVYQRWLEIFPDDPRAKHFLAALTQEKVPARASNDYVRATFDIFAANFDSELAQLEYRAPALVNEGVTRLCGTPEPCLTVLDAGCGTGLCAPFLRPRARHLVGVDLSPAMIEEARKRGLFDALAVEELTAHLHEHAATYDVIVSADTLVYFGDLGEVTLAAARALRPGGALVFTAERTHAEDAPAGFRINPHGRYSHTRDHLSRSLANAGLVDLEIREVDLRKEAEQWVAGWLCSAKVGSISA